jgi:purine-binding chemotaxis protein CheW
VLESGAKQRRSAQSQNDVEHQYLVVYVGEERYATPLEQVREVVDAKPCLPVPNALPYVEGIVDLRGQILSVLDLSRLVTGAPAKTPCRVTLVVELDEGMVGLNVEDLFGVVPLTQSQIMLEATQSGESRLVTIGVAKIEEQLVTLIDVRGLVTRTPVLRA